jgi:ADP-heptose:LPS heptosyltransferase
MDITIKSFNGIGDLLFLTPTLRAIKKTYPEARITVNTNYPILLNNNPFVSLVGTKDEGVFLGYPDPIHCVNPTQHHILSDWEIVTRHYNLETPKPELQPELYCRNSGRIASGMSIGVQVSHKGHWDGKKVWPYCTDLVDQIACKDQEIRAIPQCSSLIELISFIASLRLVVCCEGGVQHIAKAVGTPAIVIYGGFAKPEWNGYEDHVNICNPKPCSYCYNPFKCVSENPKECMTEITVKQVVKEIENIII